ncbi:MAG: hypothetical protein WC711_03990 [Candidatus Staskawiczbacteria bacterium]|jgi:hypothetical protein
MAEKKNKKEKQKANKKESKQARKQSNPKVIITTTIDVNIHKRARDKGISWTKALELGVLFLLKETEKPKEETSETEEEPIKEEEPIPA